MTVKWVELASVLNYLRSRRKTLDKGNTLEVLSSEGLSDVIGVALVVLDWAMLTVE